MGNKDSELLNILLVVSPLTSEGAAFMMSDLEALAIELSLKYNVLALFFLEDSSSNRIYSTQTKALNQYQRLKISFKPSKWKGLYNWRLHTVFKAAQKLSKSWMPKADVVLYLNPGPTAYLKRSFSLYNKAKHLSLKCDFLNSFLVFPSDFSLFSESPIPINYPMELNRDRVNKNANQSIFYGFEKDFHQFKKSDYFMDQRHHTEDSLMCIFPFIKGKHKDSSLFHKALKDVNWNEVHTLYIRLVDSFSHYLAYLGFKKGVQIVYLSDEFDNPFLPKNINVVSDSIALQGCSWMYHKIQLDDEIFDYWQENFAIDSVAFSLAQILKRKYSLDL